MNHRLYHLFYICLLGICGISCNGGSDQGAKVRHADSHLTLSSSDDPTSFDPRLSRSLQSGTYLRMLYEGLMRVDLNGKVRPAIAEKITVSDDLKTYTFHLRQAHWSDGSKVTAHDFVNTWKSQLSPTFPAPNAYQFYVIKGAKEAKTGKISLDSKEIGIHAPTADTLVVELNSPTPYFLDLLSCHFFLPVHSSLQSESAHQKTHGVLISNGPFKLTSFQMRNGFTVKKNENYWDKSKVFLSTITVQIVNDNPALQLYKKGQIDWVGSPMMSLPRDALPSLKASHNLHVMPSGATLWIKMNTDKGLFNNKSLRKAFSLAINRQEIVLHITQGNEIPALAIVPKSFGLLKNHYFDDGDVSKGKELFSQALKEMNMEKKDLPKITIHYSSSAERLHKIAQALQQQWKSAFDIHIDIASTEGKLLLDKINSGDFQMTLGEWYADIDDPVNFLEIFAFKENPTNKTGWENPQYQKLLLASQIETDHSKRAQLLTEAEEILLNELPVTPIYYPAYNYLYVPNLQGVYFSSLGFLDFKEAKFNE